MRLKWILPVVLLVVALGCQSSDTKKKKDKEQAREHWSRARANVLYGLAKDQYTTGNFDPARQTVQEALVMDPDNEPVRVLSARLAIEGGQLELADKELEKARKLNPKDAEADYLSGVVYQRWQKPDIAYGHYSDASEKVPDDVSYLMAKSEMLVAMGRQEEALRLLQDKVVYFEHSAVIRDAVGQLLCQFHKYDEAADMLRQATILATDDLTIVEHLAFALFHANQYRDAIEPFQRLLKNDQYSNRADLYLALGQCLMEVNKTHEARQAFESSARLDDQVPGAWIGLARAALEQNDLSRAELSLKRALSLDPARPETRLMMGYVRLKQGKLQEALSSFQRANALDNSDTVSLCMIGYTLVRLGRTDDAMRYYAQALKIKPGDEMAARLMASVDKD